MNVNNRNNQEMNNNDQKVDTNSNLQSDSISPKKIPADKQIDSKDWNIRKNCYLKIIKNLEVENFEQILYSQIYSKTDDTLIEYLPKIAEDNLPQSLEIGLDVILFILKNDENDNHLIEEEIKFNIMKGVLDKSIFSIKSSCKEKSKEIIMILFEYNLNLINRFMELFTKIFESNKPKVNNNVFLYFILVNYYCNKCYKRTYREFWNGGIFIRIYWQSYNEAVRKYEYRG